MLNAQSRTLNYLLAALPPEDFRRISADLSVSEVRARQVLQKRDQPLRQVFFPGRVLCSLLITMADGAAAEIAVVGAEGLVGIDAVLGATSASCDATIQVAGEGVGHMMEIDAFRRELDLRGAFYTNIMKYTQAFVTFATQSVVCNGLHTVDARCCRWLLHAQDRLGSDELRLTQELLSTMLGVRRPTVTLVMAELVRHGIIVATRGFIRIADRKALEGRACECYNVVRTAFANRLLFDTAALESDHGLDSGRESTPFPAAGRG